MCCCWYSLPLYNRCLQPSRVKTQASQHTSPSQYSSFNVGRSSIDDRDVLLVLRTSLGLGLTAVLSDNCSSARSCCCCCCCFSCCSKSLRDATRETSRSLSCAKRVLNASMRFCRTFGSCRLDTAGRTAMICQTVYKETVKRCKTHAYGLCPVASLTPSTLH